MSKVWTRRTGWFLAALLACAVLVVGCSGRLSLAEYQAQCPEWLVLHDRAAKGVGVDTLGGARDAADDYAESLRVNPPPELVDLHNLEVDLAAYIQEIIDMRLAADGAGDSDAFSGVSEWEGFWEENQARLDSILDQLDPDSSAAAEACGWETA